MKLGVLPVVPVLGALPSAPVPAGWVVAAALAVPVVAGALAGWRSARAAEPTDLGLVSRLLDALLAAVGAAVLLGLLVALSRGPIGPGRMAQVGANPLVVAPFLAIGLAIGALPVAAVVTWVRSRSAAGPPSPSQCPNQCPGQCPNQCPQTVLQVADPPVEL